MRYSIVAMCAFFFRTCCFEVLYSQLWKVLHFMSQMFLSEFSSLTQKNPLFHPFVLFQAVTSVDAGFSQIQKGFRLKVTPTEEANGPENVHCVSICCIFCVVVV